MQAIVIKLYNHSKLTCRTWMDRISVILCSKYLHKYSLKVIFFQAKSINRIGTLELPFLSEPANLDNLILGLTRGEKFDFSLNSNSPTCWNLKGTSSCHSMEQRWHLGSWTLSQEIEKNNRLEDDSCSQLSLLMAFFEDPNNCKWVWGLQLLVDNLLVVSKGLLLYIVNQLTKYVQASFPMKESINILLFPLYDWNIYSLDILP